MLVRRDSSRVRARVCDPRVKGECAWSQVSGCPLCEEKKK